MKHIFLLILLFPLFAIAQNTVNIRGTVYESQTLDAMEGVSIKLYRDSTMVTGALSVKNGTFLLPAVPTGVYSMRISMMGYKEQNFTVTLPAKGGNYRVGDIMMREQTTMMTETVVTGKAPEMTVVEDTIVYNASAFTLPDGALVEELIKKLPGVVQEENGSFTVNGKPVSQILVDGKEFFGNNQNMILKNLPVDIVEKVKAYEKKSDLARITGIDDGNERTVLDLSIKKDKKRGWFGNIEGGYGVPQNRYQGRIMVNRFVGEQKYSLISNVGNTGGNGLTDSQSAGLTMNRQNERLELNGSVNANFSQSHNANSSNSQSFENKNAAYTNRRSASHNNNKDLSFNYKVEWKPDTLTNLIFRPELSWGKSSSGSSSLNASFREDPYAVPGVTDPLDQMELLRSIGVNRNQNTNSSNNSNINARGSLQINRRLQKPGRNLTLNLNGGYGSNDSYSDSYNQIDYYQILAVTGQDSIYHKTQFNEGINRNHNLSARLSYTEPIGYQVYLQMSYQFNYRFQDRNRNVYSIFDPWNDYYGVSFDNYQEFRPYAVTDTAQCDYTTNYYYNHDVRLQLRINRTHYQLTAGVNLQPQTNTVDYNKGLKHYDVSRSVFNWSPTVNFRYRFSKQEQLDFRYNGNTGQPSITDLIPDTLSNANPLNIRIGNATLKPSFTSNIQANYNRSVPDLQRSYALNVQFRTTQNSVSSRTEYNEVTGGRITMPVNVNGNWNASTSFNFNTAFTGDQRFRINTHTQASMTNAVGYVYQSKTHQTVHNQTRGTNVSQNLRLSFRNDWLEVSGFGSIRYNHSRSTATSASNLDTYSYNYGVSTTMNLPWGMSFSTDISQNSRRGYTDASMNTNELIWNAQLSQRFLPKKNLTLSVRAYDILGQRDNVSRNISATSRTDTRNSSIHQYAVFTLSYRFGQFGGRRSGNRGNREGAERVEDSERPSRPEGASQRPGRSENSNPRFGGGGGRGR